MSSIQFTRPDAIVDADWLAANLDDPNLRVYDCTTYLDPPAPCVAAAYTIRSGEEDFLDAHIPGSNFLDLQRDLSAQDSDPRLHFTMPEADQLADTMAQKGIGADSRVVLYARGNMQWATRVWWMLYAIGFDNAAILDGGMDNWTARGLPIHQEVQAYTAATPWPASPRPEAFADRDEVVAAMSSATTCTLNALSNALHTGVDDRYGRPGRIPGSVNLPAADLQASDVRTFLAPHEVAARFSDVVPGDTTRTIVYCGGGIAATLDAFLMLQLGYGNIGVYDASMSEWANDHNLPMVSGPETDARG